MKVNDQKTQMNVSIARLFLSFFRLGATAFGGPAMMAHVKELAVKRNAWIDEERFRQGIALCQSIPGATVMQMVAYVGMSARGVPGAFASFVGFGLPAFLIMLAFSAGYAASHRLPAIVSLFAGLQVLVVAITAHAAYLLACDTIKSLRVLVLALCSSALLLAGMNPFLVLIVAAASGIITFRDMHVATLMLHTSGNTKLLTGSSLLLMLVVCICLVLLAVTHNELFALAMLMMKIDLFAFGGGFGSLPLMFHEIVESRQWLDSGTFMQGIALGQVTPGPIVITATFVGYLTYGFPGALVATIAIFTPSFLILIITMPLFERLKASPYFSRAIKGVLASFVGLLFFVLLKFGLAVHWDWRGALLVITALTALMMKADILPIVIVVGIISMLVF
jgi:chromate transporter